MIEKSLLAQVQSIYLKSRRLATEAFTGEFLSAFHGQGMEFAEFREYIPGDDIRNIDWNVTARFDKPFIKIHHEEREQTVILVVDTSASLHFGSTGATKRKYLADLSALIAYAANTGQDKIGLILFSDKIEVFIPPRKGRSHVWHIIRTIFTHQPSHRGTDISVALDYLNKVIHRQSLAFLISDFLTEETYSDKLRASNVKHDIISIVIRDPLENEFKVPYLFSFKDEETGEIIDVDMSSGKNRAIYASVQKKKAVILKQSFDKLGMDSLFLLVGQDYLKPLIKLFRIREKKHA